MPKPADSAFFCTILHSQKRALLLAYVDLGRLRAACRAAHVSPQLHYYWLRTDLDYHAAFTEAQTIAGDLLEEEAVRRAHDGVTRTVFHQGIPIAEEHRYSDTLLIFLLKGAKPQKYAERTELTGVRGGPIQISIQGDLGSGNDYSVQIPQAASGTNGAVHGHETL